MGRDAKGRFTAGIEVAVIDRSTAPLRAITNNFRTLEMAGKKASKAFDLSAKIKQSADNLKDFSDEIGDLAKKPVEKFMDFEKQMSKVRAATFNGDQSAEAKRGFEELSATARKLGADTQFSGMQAAEGMEILATQGFNAAQQMAAMPGILNVAAASTESIATSSEIATAAMNQFGLKAGDMGRIGDVLIKTANSSSTGLVDIGEAMKYTGTEAAKAGVSLEKTTAMIGVLGDAGVKGSMAGTALRAMLSGFQAPSKQGKSALQFLGINTKDKAGNLRPIEELLADMDRAMDKKFGAGKGGNRRAALLKAIFGEEAKSAAGILLDKAGGGELQKAIAANMDAQGTASAVAADVSNNAAGAAAELDSALEELQLTIGEKVIPAVVDLLKGSKEVITDITTWASAHPELVKGLTLTAGALSLIGMVCVPVARGVGALVTIWGGLTYAMGLASTAGQMLTGGTGLFKTLALDIGLMKTGLVSALRAITAAAMANPIIAIITGIAVAAYLIYENWDTLKAWWLSLWDKLPGPVQSAIRLATIPIRVLVRAAQSIYEGWGYISEWFAGLWGSISGPVTDAIAIITSPITWLIDQAVNLMGGWGKFGEFFGSMWEGIKGIVGAIVDWIAAKLDWVGQQVEDLERSLPAWMTGREPLAVQGALARAQEGRAEVQRRLEASGPSAPGLDVAGFAQAVKQAFAGELKVTIDAEGRVTKTEVSGATPAFGVRVNAGAQ